MSRRSITLCFAAAILGLALAISLNYAWQQRRERLRLEQNQSALVEQMYGQLGAYRVRDSLNAVSNLIITQTVSEFDRNFAMMRELMGQMKLKIRNIETLSQSATKSDYEIRTVLRDTTIAVLNDRDTLALPLAAHALHYRDAYLRLSGVITKGEFHGKITSYDTLVHIVHRVPRGFWFIRWGTKELRQEVVSLNPHTQITYNRTVKISR